MKNVMQDQKGCKNNIRAEEEQITAARAKQQEDEEEDAGIRAKNTRNTKKKRPYRKKHFEVAIECTALISSPNLLELD